MRMRHSSPSLVRFSFLFALVFRPDSSPVPVAFLPLPAAAEGAQSPSSLPPSDSSSELDSRAATSEGQTQVQPSRYQLQLVLMYWNAKGCARLRRSAAHVPILRRTPRWPGRGGLYPVLWYGGTAAHWQMGQPLGS